MPATLSMLSRIALFGVFFLLFLGGCYKNHLYVQQEWIDREFLASSWVGTPDPRQSHPPDGQRLIIAWDFPRSVFVEDLTMRITVRLWDNTETLFVKPLERKRDITSYYFPAEDREKRILTYLVEVVDGKDEVIEVWKHHFWTELIQVGE